MPDKPQGLVFPTQFPLKAIGKNTGKFEDEVIEIVRRHVPELPDTAISRRLSRDGKYLSVTAVFIAQSQEQLDGIYYELSSHADMMMVL